MLMFKKLIVERALENFNYLTAGYFIKWEDHNMFLREAATAGK